MRVYQFRHLGKVRRPCKRAGQRCQRVFPSRMRARRLSPAWEPETEVGPAADLRRGRRNRRPPPCLAEVLGSRRAAPTLVHWLSGSRRPVPCHRRSTPEACLPLVPWKVRTCPAGLPGAQLENPRTSAIEYKPGALPCAHCAALTAPRANMVRSSAMCDSTTRSPRPASTTEWSPTTDPPRKLA